jgi:hypothetical protein
MKFMQKNGGELLKAVREEGNESALAMYFAKGKQVRCTHCNSVEFMKQQMPIKCPEAHCLVCNNCGHAEWFVEAPEEKVSK